MSKHIFVSYRSVERDFALQLSKDLMQAGYPIWMDRLGGLLPGDNWRNTLHNGIIGAAGVVACLSRNYIDSVWCRRELELADMERKPIFPVKIGELSDSHMMAITLQETHYGDFTYWKNPYAYAPAFAELLAGLERQLTFISRTPITPPALGPLNPDRFDPEDQAEQRIAEANAIPIQDDFAKIQAEQLALDIDQLLKEYRAIMNERRSLLDPVMLAKLETRKESYEAQIVDLKVELRELRGE